MKDGQYLQREPIGLEAGLLMALRRERMSASILFSAFLAACVASSVASAANSSSVGQAVDTRVIVPNEFYYPSVVALSRGPFLPTRYVNKLAVSPAYRIVVVQNEAQIELMVETITWGEEGCCARVTETRMLDLHLNGPAEGVKILKWKSSTAAIIEIFGKTFSLDNLDGRTVQLTPFSSGK